MGVPSETITLCQCLWPLTRPHFFQFVHLRNVPTPPRANGTSASRFLVQKWPTGQPTFSLESLLLDQNQQLTAAPRGSRPNGLPKRGHVRPPRYGFSVISQPPTAKIRDRRWISKAAPGCPSTRAHPVFGGWQKKCLRYFITQIIFRWAHFLIFRSCDKRFKNAHSEQRACPVFSACYDVIFLHILWRSADLTVLDGWSCQCFSWTSSLTNHNRQSAFARPSVATGVIECVWPFHMSNMSRITADLRARRIAPEKHTRKLGESRMSLGAKWHLSDVHFASGSKGRWQLCLFVSGAMGVWWVSRNEHDVPIGKWGCPS